MTDFITIYQQRQGVTHVARRLGKLDHAGVRLELVPRHVEQHVGLWRHLLATIGGLVIEYHLRRQLVGVPRVGESDLKDGFHVV